MSVFGKDICSGFLPIFVQVVCFFDIELYELFVYFGYYLLLVTSLENIFSYYIGCLLVLLTVSLAVQKYLSLIGYHLFKLLFLLPCETDSLKNMAKVSVRVPMFFSRIFMFSILTFRSLIPFKFIFAYGVRKCLISFFYMWLSSTI